jgi:hypothetical protein
MKLDLLTNATVADDAIRFVSMYNAAKWLKNTIKASRRHKRSKPDRQGIISCRILMKSKN